MRFFTDACVPQTIVEMLRNLGWDVQTAYEVGLAYKIKEDALLHYATANNRFFLTLDDLRGEHGKLVSRELRLSGGKLIRVGGGPAQDPYRIVGKLLFHCSVWKPFLDAQDGVVVIQDIKGCKQFRPDDYHHQYHATDAAQFDAYLASHGKRARTGPKRKKKLPDSSQLALP